MDPDKSSAVLVMRTLMLTFIALTILVLLFVSPRIHAAWVIGLGMYLSVAAILIVAEMCTRTICEHHHSSKCGVENMV